MLGAVLYGMGVPQGSAIQYEATLKANGFLVMAYETVDEIVHAKAILGTANPTRLDEFTGSKTEDREDVGALDAS